MARSRFRSAPPVPASPTAAQRAWLCLGLDQPGGKLPLFDRDGQRVSPGLVRACLEAGWAEPWFSNPIKPDWQVCRLTESGRALLARLTVVAVDFRRRRRSIGGAGGS